MKLLPILLSSLMAVAVQAQAQVRAVVVGPQTGQFATFWDQLKKGSETAAQVINANGGINGQRLVVDFADDACDPRQAVSVANQNVTRKYDVVIGHFCSGTSVAALDVYAENNVLMISPASVVSALTEKGHKSVFRTVGRDDQQGQVIAQALVNRKLGDNLAIIHDKSTYGKGLADQVKRYANAAGVTEKLTDSISAGEKDFSALLTRLRQQGITSVFFGGYHPEMGLMLRQARELGFKATFLGGDAMKTAELGTIAGAATDGLLFSFFPDPKNNPEAKLAVDRLRAGGFEPEGFTLYVYAALEAFAASANAAKSTQTEKVADALRTKGPYSTVIGPIRFNAKGDVDRNLYRLYEWRGGKFDVSR